MNNGDKSVTNTWELYFDGAAMPTNPGPRGIGALLISPEGEMFSVSKGVGFGSNNEAEYMALIEGMKLAVAQGARSVLAKGDSALVVNQLSGNWQVRTETLLPLYQSAVQLRDMFDKIVFQWIPRDQNKDADKLSKAGVKTSTYGENIEEDKVWGNQVDVGKELGISAIAVGRFLDKYGLRENKRPTKLACDRNLARVYGTVNFFQSDWCIPTVAALYLQKKDEFETIKKADIPTEFGTLSDIGKILGISAVAVGKFLIKAGMRDGKFPTPKACELGLARDRSEKMFYQKEWHIQNVVNYFNQNHVRIDGITENEREVPRWGKISVIAKEIGVSTRAMGAFLDKHGFRIDGEPIKEELCSRHARPVGDTVKPQFEWDIDYVVHKYHQIHQLEQGVNDNILQENSASEYRFRVHAQTEPGAGIEFFGDAVTVKVESGDPGREPGEFETAMTDFLKEWYQARVSLDISGSKDKNTFFDGDGI